MKVFKIFILVFILISFNLDAEEELNNLNNKDNQKKQEEKSKNETKEKKYFDILKWGLNSQINSVLVELTKNKNKKFADAIEILYESSPSNQIKSKIINYYKTIEDFRILDQAIEGIRYYDSEPDSFIIFSIDYIIVANKKEKPLPKDIGEILWNIFDYGNEIIGTKALSALAELKEKQYVEEIKTRIEDYSVSKSIRSELIKAVGKLSYEKEKEWILNLLNSDISKSERWAICEILALAKDPTVTKILKNEFKNGDPYLRLRIIDSLENMEKSLQDQFITLGLRDEFWRVRKESLKQCGEKKLTQLVPEIIFKVKTEPEHVVKLEAINTLGMLGTTDSLQFLNKIILNDKGSLSLRKKAISSLYYFPSSGYLNNLLKIIKEEEKAGDITLTHYIALEAAKSKRKDLDSLYNYLIKNNKPPIQHAAVLGMLNSNKIMQEERLKKLLKKNEQNYLGQSIQKLFDQQNKLTGN